MIYFKEKQPFGTVKLWVILMAISIITLGGIMSAFYMQLQLKQPIDNNLSDNQLIIMGVGIMIAISLFDWLLLSGKLETEIRNYTIRYRFPPFQWSWKVLKRADIQSFVVREYNPTKEFKGHGYRLLRKEKALSVTGTMGLQLTFSSGKKLLLGTQKPKELQQVMELLMEKEIDHG